MATGGTSSPDTMHGTRATRDTDGHGTPDALSMHFPRCRDNDRLVEGLQR